MAITQYATYILMVMPAHAVGILDFVGIKCCDLIWWLNCCDVFQSLSVALSHVQYKGKHQGEAAKMLGTNRQQRTAED